MGFVFLLKFIYLFHSRLYAAIAKLDIIR